MSKRVQIDAVGQQCPIPVVRASRALREMQEGGSLEIRVDNQAAVENLTRMAAGFHARSHFEKLGESLYVVTVEMDALPADAPAEEEMTAACSVTPQGDFVIAVDSREMGRGDETLGRTLMKGFLYAVGQLPELPRTMLFYNGGAWLTVEGSESLEDLKALEQRGVEILTCGTCLNYYGISEKLAVGSITNMYAIAEKLAGAGKVVKP